MEENNQNIEINDLGVKFEDIGIQISDKSSKYYLYNSLHPKNQNERKAMIYKTNTKWNYNINSIITFSFEFTNIIDYRLNIFEICPQDKFILIACSKKLILIPFDPFTYNFSKPKMILTCSDLINQIKLMSIPNKPEHIIICLDDSGIITTAQIRYESNEHKISNRKLFNGRLASNDNSIWSVDVHYPYIIIGGNHKGILVFNYEEDSTIDNNNINVNSVLYKGNQHNVPSVRISPCGLFIASNSIDSNTKIFDVYTNKMLCKLNNPKCEWGWNVIFIPKRLFTYKEYFYDFVSNDNEYNYVINAFRLKNANLTNKNSLYKHPEQSLNNNNNNSNDFYYKRYIQTNLIDQYYILSTYHGIACLDELVIVELEGYNWFIRKKPLGKVELFRNFLLERFRGYDSFSYVEMMILENIKSCGRYEYLFISERMRLIFIGNKTGDLQIYRMVIEIGECDDKIGIIDTPDVIIDYDEKLAGMRMIENEGVVDIYAMDLKGTFHQHRITKKNEIITCNEINNDEMEIEN